MITRFPQFSATPRLIPFGSKPAPQNFPKLTNVEIKEAELLGFEHLGLMAGLTEEFVLGWLPKLALSTQSPLPERDTSDLKQLDSLIYAHAAPIAEKLKSETVSLKNLLPFYFTKLALASCLKIRETLYGAGSSQAAEVRNALANIYGELGTTAAEHVFTLSKAYGKELPDITI
jgi:hypothetical protein